MRPDELERQLRERLDALGPAPRTELLHVLMLPDFDRADRIGEFWSYPESRTFAELLIDCEEDRTRWREPGVRHRVKTFRLKADAERFLVSIEDSMHRGAYHDPNAGRETFGAFWDEERATAARTGRLSERTLIAYDEIVRLYLEPLARRPLSSITKAHVEDVVRGSASRAADVHKVLRAILGRAVKAGKIATNPATGVDVSKPARAEPRTLSGEELDRLVDAMPTVIEPSS